MATFWIIYGALGLLTLATVLWDHLRRRGLAAAELDPLLEAMPDQRRDLGYRLRDGLASVLAGALVWLLWPLAAGWTIALARRVPVRQPSALRRIAADCTRACPTSRGRSIEP